MNNKMTGFFRTIALYAFCCCSIANVALPYAYWRHKLVPNPGPNDAGEVQGDFALRYNEAECVRKRLDPYDIWSGRLRSAEYYPYNKPELKSPGATKKVNAYPPWEYAWMLPATRLPIRVAWRIFDALMVCLVLSLFAMGFIAGFRREHQYQDAWFVSSAALCVGYAAERVFIYGNYGVFMAFTCFALAFCLDRDRDALAGLCMALLMTKPQIGMLFCIPILISGKWKAIIVATSILIGSTIPVANLIGKTPMELVLQIPKYGSNVLHETLLLPKPLFSKLAQHAGWSVATGVNAGLGILLCAWLSLKCRKARCWNVRLAPAVLFSTAWTYCIFHDRWIYSFLNVIFAIAVLTKEYPIRLRLSALVAICCNESTAVLSLIDRFPALRERFSLDILTPLGTLISNVSFLVQSLNVVLMAIILFFVGTRERGERFFASGKEQQQ